MRHRVVIAAADAITSIGDDLDATFTNLVAGRTSFTEVRRFEVSGAVNRLAALRSRERSSDELVAQLGLRIGSVAVDRAYYAGSPDERPPSLPATVRRMSACDTEPGGWDRIYTGACVASSTALVDAATAVAYGWCRSVLVVAARRIDAGTFHAFSAGGAMTREVVPRPLTTNRSGVLLGDGAAALLLIADDALEAPGPYVELSGWGRAGDGFHACQPEPTGRGMVTAIRRALAVADLEAAAITHVSMHGTGTVLGDAAEAHALADVFGASTIPATHAPKSAVGHLLEASGLVEAAIATKAITASTVPPSLGIRPGDAPLFRGVTTEATHADITHALSLNLAFGGCNTALLLSRWCPSKGGTADIYRDPPVLNLRTVARPESKPPTLPGFVESSFPHAMHDAAHRCLDAAGLTAQELAQTAVLLLVPNGDSETIAAVQRRLASGRRLPPSLFVQSTPSSIVGYIAHKWGLRGGTNVVSTTRALDDQHVVRMTAELAAADDASHILVVRFLPGDSNPLADGPGRAEAALHTR